MESCNGVGAKKSRMMLLP